MAISVSVIVIAVTVILKDGFEQIDGLLRLGRVCLPCIGDPCMKEGSKSDDHAIKISLTAYFTLPP
jgi:hypothetical protein